MKFDIVIPFIIFGGFLLFWLVIYLHDRHKKAEQRKIAMKYNIRDEDIYTPPKDWGVIVFIAVCVISIAFAIFGQIREFYSSAYQSGYEAGIEAGIEMVKEHPHEYIEW